MYFVLFRFDSHYLILIWVKKVCCKICALSTQNSIEQIFQRNSQSYFLGGIWLFLCLRRSFWAKMVEIVYSSIFNLAIWQAKSSISYSLLFDKYVVTLNESTHFYWFLLTPGIEYHRDFPQTLLKCTVGCLLTPRARSRSWLWGLHNSHLFQMVVWYCRVFLRRLTFAHTKHQKVHTFGALLLFCVLTSSWSVFFVERDARGQNICLHSPCKWYGSMVPYLLAWSTTTIVLLPARNTPSS